MRHILSKESIVLAISAALLTGCGCSSDEPQEVELILPSKYTQQDGTKVAHQIQAPLSTQAEATAQTKTEPTQPQKNTQVTSEATQQNTAAKTQQPAQKTTTKKDQSSNQSNVRKAIVINVASNDTLNMRSGAGTKFKIVEKLSPGAIIMATQNYTKPADSKHQWVKIISATGKAGWVNTHYLKIQK